MIGGRVLDASALADFATGRTLYTRTLAWAALDEASMVLAVPAAALTAAWARIPSSAHDVLEVLLGLPITVVDALDQAGARTAGTLLARDYRVGLDAAHTVLAARNRGWPVVTGEGARLRALDEAVAIEALL